MRKKSILKMTFVFLTVNCKRMFLILIMNMICFLLLIFGLYLYEQSYYNRDSCNAVLSSGIEGTGMIEVLSSDWFSEKSSSFLSDLNAHDGIISCGEISSGYVEYFPELREQQQKLVDGLQYIPSDSLQMVYINPDFWEMCNISLCAGEKPKIMKENLYHMYLYLGYNYRNIPIGTKYEHKWGDITITATVCGTFEKNSRIVSEAVFSQEDWLNVLSYQELNNQIVCITDDNVCTNRCLFRIDTQNYDMNTVIDYIKQVAKKYDLDIQIGKLGAAFDKVEKESSLVREYVFQLFYIVFFISVAIILCIQIIDFVSNQYNYGVMRIIGYSQDDLLWVLMLQNFIKILCSYVFASALAMFIIQKYCATSATIANVIKDILLQVILGKGLFILIVLLLISTMFPLFIVKRTSIVQLLKRS